MPPIANKLVDVAIAIALTAAMLAQNLDDSGRNTARAAGMRTPVIVMTALKDAGIAQQVDKLAFGAVLLRKPFALDHLQSALRNVLPPSGASPAALARH